MEAFLQLLLYCCQAQNGTDAQLLLGSVLEEFTVLPGNPLHSHELPPLTGVIYTLKYI